MTLAAEYGISPQTESEGKTYTVSIARCDGKHLTDEDYAWIRERLGMRPDGDA